MNTRQWLIAMAPLALVVCQTVGWADVEPVSVSLKTQQCWVGQRATFNVTLRGEGPFTGAASFSLPQVPRCVIVKVGDPVVGTEDHDGASWYTQTHEFALFSQREGEVEVPPFSVRFSNKKDPDSPPVDRDVKTETLTFTIKRPAGGDADAFVVTTTGITITERWDPPPRPAQQGAVFHRTITQDADETTGMALAPPSAAASDGVRVHLGRPSVSDHTERGDLRGSRSDTITYVLEAAGALSVPAIKYVWWDADKEEFGSKTLPAVTFDVAAVPDPKPSGGNQPRRALWWVVALAFAACGFSLWIARRELASWWRRVASTLSPPEHAAARRLLKACRHDEACEAETAWLLWRSTQSDETSLPHRLRTAVGELDRHLYGPTATKPWSGDTLAEALRAYRIDQRQSTVVRPTSLPRLNPSDGCR